MSIVISSIKNYRSSAQKVRALTRLIKGQSVEKALDNLIYSKQKASGMLKKLLESAIANAEKRSNPEDAHAARPDSSTRPSRQDRSPQLCFQNLKVSNQWNSVLGIEPHTSAVRVTGAS